MNFYNQNTASLNSYFKVSKFGKTSNASKNITKLSFFFPLQFKFNKLLLRKGWLSGRTNTGRITVFTKGPRLKKKIPFLNYSFRVRSLFFVAGVNYVNFTRKIASLVFTSSGEVSYIPSRAEDNLFMLVSYKSLLKKISTYALKDVLTLMPYLLLKQIPYIITQQLKNVSLSFLELWPLKGIQYVRSFGSRSHIIKLDTRTGLSLIKLPSGLQKTFSIFSISSHGRANLYILKKNFKNTKSGFWRNKGYKSTVRGVAMNPVDHPHGGRTNAIKYPRTPWGKTTKFK